MTTLGGKSAFPENMRCPLGSGGIGMATSLDSCRTPISSSHRLQLHRSSFGDGDAESRRSRARHLDSLRITRTYRSIWRRSAMRAEPSTRCSKKVRDRLKGQAARPARLRSRREIAAQGSVDGQVGCTA